MTERDVAQFTFLGFASHDIVKIPVVEEGI